MRIIELDSNNFVIAVHVRLPNVVQLSDRYVIHNEELPLGSSFDPVSQTFGPPVRRRWITKLAFWNRLTQAERINVDLTSERPIQLADELEADFAIRRSTAAALRDMRTQLDAASYMDLSRADTQAGVQALEAMGLLAAGRATEILDGPILSHEYYPDA